MVSGKFFASKVYCLNSALFQLHNPGRATVRGHWIQLEPASWSDNWGGIYRLDIYCSWLDETPPEGHSKRTPAAAN